MRLKLHFDEQIAGLAVARRRRTLARQADMLAWQYALGHLNIERTLLRDQSALLVDLGDPQGEGTRAAVQRRLEIEQHFCMMIFAAPGVKTAALRAGTRLRAEQR